jgi:shikimate 5-dehydrogenase
VNTLRFEADGSIHADNTDGIGLVNDIVRNAAVPLQGKALLLIGAGGAAAGVLGPLLDAGASRVVVANRTVGKAVELVRRHAAWRCATAPRSRPGRSTKCPARSTSWSTPRPPASRATRCR